MTNPDSQPPARPSRGAPPGDHVGANGRAVESLETHDIRWHLRAELPFWAERSRQIRMARLVGRLLRVTKAHAPRCGFRVKGSLFENGIPSTLTDVRKMVEAVVRLGCHWTECYQTYDIPTLKWAFVRSCADKVEWV